MPRTANSLTFTTPHKPPICAADQIPDGVLQRAKFSAAGTETVLRAGSGHS